MKIGGNIIPVCPPEYIQDFESTMIEMDPEAQVGDYPYQATVKMSGKMMTDIDDMILSLVQNSYVAAGQIALRWGYPSSEEDLAVIPWIYYMLGDYQPNFSAYNQSVTLSLASTGLVRMDDLIPKCLKMTAYEFVKEAARLLKLQFVGEPTTDEPIWHVVHQPFRQYIRSNLVGKAESASTEAPYLFYLDLLDGELTPEYPAVLHFHPAKYIAEGFEPPVFNVFYGQRDDSVIDWTPKTVGTSIFRGVAGTKVRLVDPLTKTATTVELNTKEWDSAEYRRFLSEFGEDQSIIEPIASVRPSDLQFISDTMLYLYSDSYGSQYDRNAMRAALSRWARLAEACNQGILTVVGTKKTVLINVGTMIRINAYVPDASGDGYRVHYSSGLWRIVRRVDSISGAWTISFTVRRYIRVGN